MPWFGKNEEETEAEKLQRRIAQLEEEKRKRDRGDNASLTNTYVSED